MRLHRPALGSITLSALVAAWLLFGPNLSFWSRGLEYFGRYPLTLAAFAAGLYLLFFAALTTLSVKYLIKPLFIALILIAAAASFYMDTFGILVDRQMIQNVMLTTPAEARHLITPDYVLHMILFGLLPAGLVALVRVRHRDFGAKVLRNAGMVLPALALALGIVALNYQSFAGTFRAHRDLMGSLNPAAPIASAVHYAARRLQERDIVAAPLGLDARQSDRIAHSARPVVTVLVVGETARAQNFGLNGYSRDTTPELRERQVANFTDVSSCGTSTAVSVPCMFSVYPRKAYSEAKALASENLVDILTHSGQDVRWYDNDTGSMQVADRIPYEFLPAGNDTASCSGGECHDDILVKRLDKALDAVKGNSVIVLHQLGSHGPAYFERYPPEFERFRPACHSQEFSDCTRDEIVNAYDNTILYTDHVLSQMIDHLAARTDLATNLFYLSDHGESLGENGLYLHGAPYFLAPETQTHVPMIAWFSPGYGDLVSLDRACVANLTDAELSQDNVFHTMLGMSEVSTAVYEPGLDIFAPCRNAQVAEAQTGVVR